MGGLSAFIVIALFSPWAAAADSCVDCHRLIEAGGLPRHSVADWAASPHARADVGCAACHGGDPAARGKQAAHRGIGRSTDPASRVYFARVSETCGACHAAQWEPFKSSAHYRELRRTGKGPTCVTCHGSMAGRVMAAVELEAACALCHPRPSGAAKALFELQAAAAAVGRLKKSPSPDAAERLQAAVRDWHRFDLPSAERRARQARALAVRALKAAPPDGGAP